MPTGAHRNRHLAELSRLVEGVGAFLLIALSHLVSVALVLVTIIASVAMVLYVVGVWNP